MRLVHSAVQVTVRYRNPLPSKEKYTQHYPVADESVDLCASRPLGSPLADITSGCRHYSTCERLADGRLVETRHGCKKDMLFSQRRKRCTLAKKVCGCDGTELCTSVSFFFITYIVF